MVRENHRIDGKWGRWAKESRHVCCNCGLEHDVDMKVDRAGNIWMKWTSLGDKK
jgi:hypothetical protein